MVSRSAAPDEALEEEKEAVDAAQIDERHCAWQEASCRPAPMSARYCTVALPVASTIGPQERGMSAESAAQLGSEDNCRSDEADASSSAAGRKRVRVSILIK